MHGLTFARRALAATASAAAILGCAAPAVAAGLPQPVIERAHQANPLIYDAQLGSLDGNGRFAIDLIGTGLGPAGGTYAGGWLGGYVHLYVRGVRADNVAGDWQKCNDGDCTVYGGTAESVVHVGINPAFYLGEPGSHLQFKLFVTPNASFADAPEQDSTASAWSEIYTVDRARAGAVAPVAANPGPTLVRLSPDHFTQTSGAWQLTAYGDHVCGEPPRLVINGDVGGAIAATGRCMGYDEAGRPLAGKESRLVYDLPDRYRRLGSYSAALLNHYGQSSAPLSFEVRGLTIIRDVVMPRPGNDVGRMVIEPVRPPEPAVPTPPVVTPPVLTVPVIPILKLPPRR